MNSQRQPDYKAIELKVYRPRPPFREKRKPLFAKVSNWISRFSSMTDVLDAFWYFRDGRDRLSGTVSAATVNSQGLIFSVDDKGVIFNEVWASTGHGAFASWVLSDLRRPLAAKHGETLGPDGGTAHR